MNEVFLLLGSNLGDRKLNLNKAITLIEENLGKVLRKSSIYETAAFGNENQPAFLNQVVSVLVNLPPLNVLEITMNIEQQLGRTRIEKWAARTIDIDLLFIGNQLVNESNLIIPHPEIGKRRFTLEPLKEIIPEFIHPKHQTTIHDLLKTCTDNLAVKVFEKENWGRNRKGMKEL